MLEVKAILEPIEKGNYKNPHWNNLDKKYSMKNDENIRMPDIKHITFISYLFINKCTISI